jgi:4-hydroxybenzoate polyprenyltransferase
MGETDGTPEPDMVADAVRGNWVDRLAPAATRPYLRLSRADRPIGTWLLLLPCWWGVMLAAAADQGGPEPLRPVDRPGLRHRRLPDARRGLHVERHDRPRFRRRRRAHQVAPDPVRAGHGTQAFVWLVIQSLLAFCILLTFNIAAIGLVSVAPAGAIYPFAKRFTWWPQVFLGLAFNWGALLAWTAHTGSLGWPAVFLYLGGIAWTLFYDTIYAHQDAEDDALIGIKSTARLFGRTRGPGCAASWWRRSR